ncbi:MAG: HD domain-containing protein [Nitrosopumilaceae archaeon]|nr:HD domain-containing protein [Nitrosopumilaceae archaeon]NIP09876.1 HD domain-containing protein [Nitrosopumilaceae archaeon]NIS94647.1 HD domain-containing protein [Nitrosopumilaceae archaeon]
MANSETLAKAIEFAHKKHQHQKRPDGITPFVDHLEGVVNRLKNIGIANQNILSAAWLHDTIEKTDTTFEEVDSIFGNTISVLVLSLTKDKNLPKKKQEIQYINQLKNASKDSKIIKLCDASSNIKDIAKAPISRNQKNKKVRKIFHYIRVMKKDLIEAKERYPKIQELIDGINSVGKEFRLRPIILENKS